MLKPFYLSSNVSKPQRSITGKSGGFFWYVEMSKKASSRHFTRLSPCQSKLDSKRIKRRFISFEKHLQNLVLKLLHGVFHFIAPQYS